ncbi:MAG: hydrogenase [Deltaproteobacteria bacterium RIFCSPLOWO2_02_FULL_57_26]|nr:MAG: hydrogenase [Deltaproteobacteria bacterium RIFCSPLOWO2_02_FULL_57_26]
MPRINSPAELEEFRKDVISKRGPNKPCIAVCTGTGCLALGAANVVAAFKEEIKKQGLETKVEVRETGCPGFCERGPLIVIYPEEISYLQVQPGDAEEIVSQTIFAKKVIDRLLYVDPITGEKIVHESEIPFYKNQMRLLIGNNIKIDPKSIDDYLAVGGYSALVKALCQVTPEQVVELVKNSGLRGRGGAGFPTGLKWEFARKSPDETKYMIVNADEGDPGAFMDRALLEGNPFSVLEGLTIGAYAIGAHEGYVYVRQEYPLAVENVTLAIKQAEAYGFLGKNILGSGFDFTVTVHRGAGAFVCGEETALLASLEGKPGEPRARPPYPAVKGLFGKPTNINNVETWSNIPLILNKGPEYFASIGTEGSKGTKIFSLVGKVNNTGLVEVPMGITLRDIIYEVGGGIPGGKKFKAVQTGGPSGGCITEEYLDIEVDFDELRKVGAIMGSGGMIVMDEDTCMVDVAKYFLKFLSLESCGKCSPCREGIRQMLKILTRISEGKGRESDIGLLMELAESTRDASLCALGGTAPNPVLATLKYFRHEYEDHILHKRCQAGVCEELYKAKCTNACPIGQDVPGYLSLVAEGRYEEAISLIYQTNPLPGVCGRVCTHPCTDVCLRAETDEPLNIPKIKRFAADMAKRKGYTVKLEKGKAKEEKIAVIGGGPGGLAAAYSLALMGYRPTIIEELPQLGGMLRYGIPPYRLPREILDQEIDFIVNVGVEVKTNTRVGRDITLGQLQKEYDAIFVAVGAHKSLPIRVPGEDLPGVKGGAEFLREVELGIAPHPGKRVAVIGGGDVAMDIARTCRRMGAEVTIAYRRERKDMPASEEEIADAIAENIELKELVAPKSIRRANSGLALEMDVCELRDFDRSGRRRPVPIEGAVITREYDTIFSAIGQTSDLDFAESLETKGDTIAVDRHRLVTNLPGVFAGGDAVIGPARIVDALAHGKKAAVEIDRLLALKSGRDPYAESLEKIKVTMTLPEVVTEQPMAEIPKLSPEERIKDFTAEVELGFDEETAKKECGRCLRCDVSWMAARDKSMAVAG